jgi:hypothetical protein
VSGQRQTTVDEALCAEEMPCCCGGDARQWRSTQWPFCCGGDTRRRWSTRRPRSLGMDAEHQQQALGSSGEAAAGGGMAAHVQIWHWGTEERGGQGADGFWLWGARWRREKQVGCFANGHSFFHRRPWALVKYAYLPSGRISRWKLSLLPSACILVDKNSYNFHRPTSMKINLTNRNT